MMKTICSVFAVTAMTFSASAEENFAYPSDIAAWTNEVKEQQALETVKMFADVQEAISSGKKEYIVKPGNYRFGQNANWLKSFHLYRVKDFTIIADGATFWIDATFRQDAFVLKECVNVTVKGLTVDCNPFSFSQGQIIGINRDKKTLTVKLDPGFPPLETWKAGGNMKAPFFDKEDNLVPTWLDYVASYEKIAEQVYTVKLRSNYIFTYNVPVETGYRMAFPDRSNRMAFNLINSEKCALEDITVYNCPQMAFTEHGGIGGHRYSKCKVMRRPGTRRLITCNADLFHSLKVQNGPTIENCDWAWSCDDLINIHGFFSYVTEAVSDTEFIVVQSFEKENWLNAEIELLNDADMKSIGKFKVLEMDEVKNEKKVASAKEMPAELRDQKIEAGNFLGDVFIFKVKVDRPVKVKKFDVIQCYKYCGSKSVIRNNYLHDTLARGILVRGEGILVEDNKIVNIGYNGIQIMSDWYFMEGATPRNITIKNNELINCANGLHGRIQYSLHIAAINSITCHRNWEFAKNVTPIENIVVENNKVINSGVIGIAIGNTNGAKVINNTIVNSFAQGLHEAMDEKLKNAVCSIYLVESKNIEVSNNKIENISREVKPVIYGKNAK